MIHSFIHFAFIYSFTHSLTHSFIHSFMFVRSLWGKWRRWYLVLKRFSEWTFKHFLMGAWSFLERTSKILWNGRPFLECACNLFGTNVQNLFRSIQRKKNNNLKRKKTNYWWKLRLQARNSNSLLCLEGFCSTDVQTFLKWTSDFFGMDIS